jgi:hypothetical protein
LSFQVDCGFRRGRLSCAEVAPGALAESGEDGDGQGDRREQEEGRGAPVAYHQAVIVSTLPKPFMIPTPAIAAATAAVAPPA